MTLNFPNAPALGATFSAPNGITYRYDGEKWTTTGLVTTSTALQTGDNVSELVNDAGYLTTALQPGNNISELVNNSGYLTTSDVQVALDLTSVIDVDTVNNHVGIGTASTGNTLEVQDSNAIINIFNTDATGNDTHAAVVQATNGPTWNQLNINGSSVNIQSFGNTRATVKGSGILNLTSVPVYADNTAANSAGLVAGDVYRTGTGALMITF